MVIQKIQNCHIWKLTLIFIKTLGFNFSNALQKSINLTVMFGYCYSSCNMVIKKDGLCMIFTKNKEWLDLLSHLIHQTAIKLFLLFQFTSIVYTHRVLGLKFSITYMWLSSTLMFSTHSYTFWNKLNLNKYFPFIWSWIKNTLKH